MNSKEIPRLANRVLYFVTLSLLLIFVRVCYLQTSAREDHVAKARAPRQRIRIEKPTRGAIFDRFGLPLAINQIQYNAAICYAPLRDLSRLNRKDQIEQLSHFLASELDMDAQFIEDRIHSRAALFPNTPYVIASDISEQTFARLKVREHQFPGLIAQCDGKRTYPQGKVAGSVIGYLGAISESQYLKIARELSDLKDFLAQREEGIPACLPKGFENVQEVRDRYQKLKQQAYTINDMAGRSGIEAYSDHLLRGMCGKQPVEVDVRGQIIRKLPGAHTACPGTSLTLTLSAELQAFAEALLAKSEKIRDDNFANAGAEHHKFTAPWIKGGAIVAMIPQTGEIVACASYPRLNPNDFIDKNAAIHKWLETPAQRCAIWDGKQPLEKEYCTAKWTTVTEPLTWQAYLNRILSKKSAIHTRLAKVHSLKNAFRIIESAEMALHLSGQNDMAAVIHTLKPQDSALHQSLYQDLKSLVHTSDKVLFLDLLRLIADKEKFSENLIEHVGYQSLATYRALNQAANRLLAQLKTQEAQRYHETTFAKWRETHFADYLKEKRREEKKRAKPYLDYLIAIEQEQFATHWQIVKHAMLNDYIRSSDHPDAQLLQKYLQYLPEDLALEYLKTQRSADELSAPLWGQYRLLRKDTLKDLALAFYPKTAFGFAKSHAYQQSAPPGSIFKIVTAYAALKATNGQPPLTLYDESSKTMMGHFMNGKMIPRIYKGGRIPRSHAHIGKVDLQAALERSANVYFSILASDVIKEPVDLLNAAKDCGYGKKTGIDLPGEYAGSLPIDLRDNRTGLYSFAIGQHAFDGTPLQSAVMLATLAGHGQLKAPHLLKKSAGLKLLNESPLQSRTYPFKKSLQSIGIHFSLFTEASPQRTHQTTIAAIPEERTIPLTLNMRNQIFDSLHRVVNGPFGSARPNRIKALYQNPSWMRSYLSVKNSLIGKTSTAEFRYHPTLDRGSDPITCKHIAFGGISFKSKSINQRFSEPELVIIVSLPFGDYGKEAAPLAALIVEKWRKLVDAHENKPQF